MKKPTVGRTVLYVLNEGPNKGEIRPATIVRVWGDSESAVVNLQVVTDGNGQPQSNDGLPQLLWKTSVAQSDEKAPGTFHFPEINR